MKKLNLLKYSITAAFLSCTPVSEIMAQANMLSFDGNFYKDYIGERVMITSPSNVARSLDYTIANDGSGATSEWGAAVTANMDGEVVKANPYKGCTALSSVTGKIVMIERGDCEFGLKAKNAQAAGAIAVIIVNNIDGGPVGMGAGADGASVSIPVLMISKADGAALSTAIDAGTVNMSISKWGSSRTHDLAIVKSGMSMWHSHAIPGHQMQNASSHEPYKGIDAVVVANVGNSTETNVRLVSTVEFTPNGGAAELIRKDTSAPVANFAPLDSIKVILNDELYNLKNSKQEGRYDVTYEVIAQDADDFAADNKGTYSFYVTSKLYSKGRYDFANNVPFALNSNRYASTDVSAYTWGPLYYIGKGGYQIEAVQAAVSGGADQRIISALTDRLNVFVWKWVDGSAGQPADNRIQAGEVEMQGEASQVFDSDDTSGQFFTIPVQKIDKSPLVTTDNSWYWVTAAMPNTVFLATDGSTNYYTRTFARHHATDTYDEFFGPSTPDDASTVDGAADESIIGMFPFELANVTIDSARFSNQRQGLLPAIPMIMGQFPVSVKELSAGKPSDLKIYPNPATETVTVSGKLKGQAEKVHLKIMDAVGRVIKVDEKPFNANANYTMSVSDLPAGNYYMIVNTIAESAVIKFTIAK